MDEASIVNTISIDEFSSEDTKTHQYETSELRNDLILEDNPYKHIIPRELRDWIGFQEAYWT